MISCRVLLFAHLAEVAGVREVELELDADATAADALDALAERLPALQLPPHVALAIDEAYVSRTTPLSPGCTLALIPPVSGG